MQNWIIVTLATLSLFPLYGGNGSCKKCEMLREYHKNNPTKYTFYDDYLNDLEEKGPEAVQPGSDTIPDAIQFIPIIENKFTN